MKMRFLKCHNTKFYLSSILDNHGPDEWIDGTYNSLQHLIRTLITQIDIIEDTINVTANFITITLLYQGG